MTSKEALREIITATLKYLPDSVIEKNSKLSNIVLQDLERFEALEELGKGQMNYIKEQCSCIENLTQENEKLKKAIEILKRRVISLKGIKDCESAAEYNRYTSLGLITQQEYELLKEVLG